MKQQRDYPRGTVTPKGERALLGGHPWVYGEEVLSWDRPPEDGELADVVSQGGKYLGTGFVNLTSKIRVRVL